MNETAIVLGHLLLGGLFVFAGFDHFTRFRAVKSMLALRGWRYPAPMLAAASVLQIVAGLGLALGILRPWAALGLAAFTIAATLTLLDFWRFQGPRREGMRSGFLVNIGLLGGLILAFGQSFRRPARFGFARSGRSIRLPDHAPRNRRLASGRSRIRR